MVNIKNLFSKEKVDDVKIPERGSLHHLPPQRQLFELVNAYSNSGETGKIVIGRNGDEADIKVPNATEYSQVSGSHVVLSIDRRTSYAFDEDAFAKDRALGAGVGIVIEQDKSRNGIWLKAPEQEGWAKEDFYQHLNDLRGRGVRLTTQEDPLSDDDWVKFETDKHGVRNIGYLYPGTQMSLANPAKGKNIVFTIPKITTQRES